MVRWRYCLVLATLLLLPRIGAKLEDDDEEEWNSESRDTDATDAALVSPRQSDGRRRNEEGSEEDEDDDDEDEDETEREGEKPPSEAPGRRAPGILVSSPRTQTMPRTTKALPLECFVCAYKSETPLRSCLDPTKYRVHSVTCQNPDDKCFTSVISKDKSYDAVVRGCRTGCVGSAETTCCSLNRCNNQAFAMPLVPHALTVGGSQGIANPISTTSSVSKNYPSTVLFFVTVLLVLQTVVKVSFV